MAFNIFKGSCFSKILLSPEECFSRSGAGAAERMPSPSLFHGQSSDLLLYGVLGKTRLMGCTTRLYFTGSLVIPRVPYVLFNDRLYPGDGKNDKGA